MSIVSFLTLLLKVADGLMGYIRDKKLMDGAVAERVSVNLQGALNDIQMANKIRDEVRAAATANPDSLRGPDPDSRT